eukprot:COSAG01_NODE_23_length_37704_cov_30.005877_21_plen_69_part_00
MASKWRARRIIKVAVQAARELLRDLRRARVRQRRAHGRHLKGGVDTSVSRSQPPPLRAKFTTRNRRSG